MLQLRLGGATRDVPRGARARLSRRGAEAWRHPQRRDGPRLTEWGSPEISPSRRGRGPGGWSASPVWLAMWGGGTCRTMQHPEGRAYLAFWLHLSALRKPAKVSRVSPGGARRRAPATGRARPRAGSPSVWPTCSAGMVLSGMWIAPSPACGRPRCRRRAGRRRTRTRAGSSTPTASIAAAKAQRRRLRPRDLAGVDVAVDEVVDAVALEEPDVPLPRPDRVGEHADLAAPSRAAPRTSAGTRGPSRCAAPRTRSRPSSSSGSCSRPASVKRSAMVALCWWSRLLPHTTSPAAWSRVGDLGGGRARR